MVEPNPNQEPNQENTNNEEQNHIQEEEDYVITAFSRVKMAKLPKTFTEGNTNVKIAFVESHVNCRKYDSKTGLTFEYDFVLHYLYFLGLVLGLDLVQPFSHPLIIFFA